MKIKLFLNLNEVANYTNVKEVSETDKFYEILLEDKLIKIPIEIIRGIEIFENNNED